MKSLNAPKSRTCNVNLQALEVFCEVVRLQSFSSGGGTFGITQSATSQLVAHLETELGFLLFDRKRRPLRLTAEGDAYHQTCQDILARHGRTVDEVRQRTTGLGGTVRVASIYSVGLHSLNSYLQSFMEDHTDSRVVLEYHHPSRVYETVLADDAELGVVSYPRPARQLKIIPWIEEEMVVACPFDHPLAHRDVLALHDLNGQKFVSFDLDLTIRREVDRALRSQQAHVEIVGEFDNVETIKQALEVSMAISILPRPAIEKEVERGVLVGVRLDNPLRRPIGIIHNQRRSMSKTAELFLETLLRSSHR
jgi:DNA-binding transcriptional LysR family regulator